MTTAKIYRRNATRQRLLAATQSLPQVRSQLIGAAERWDWLAGEAEAMQAGMMAMFEAARLSTH